jgi:hypothetical protein
MSQHHVKGTMFVDSAQQLLERDLFLPAQWRVTNDAWYPMETYENVAVAWLHLIGAGNAETFRSLGAKSADRLLTEYPDLVAPGDLRESLIRFLVIRQCLFDFPAVEVVGVSDLDVKLKLEFGMRPDAEQAAAFHTSGFLARLLELGGALNVDVRLAERTWDGDVQTMLEASWKPPVH